MSDLTKPESKPADNLKRQMRDARRLLGLIRIELKLPAFVPRWYRATVNAVLDYPKLLKKTAQGVKIGVDLARPAADGWSEFSHKFKHAILDGVETAAGGYIKLANKWEAERGPISGVGDPTKPPAALDIDEVKQMILHGKAPPARWVPWIKELGFDEESFTDLVPLAGLTALQSLYVLNTKMKDIAPLAGLTALQYLNLSSTGIIDLSPLSGLFSLKKVSLFNTCVSDLSPLMGLSNLREIDLDHTDLFNILPLAGLTDLREIDIVNTNVTALSPLKNLKALEHIYVEPGRVHKLRLTLGRNGIVKTTPWLRANRKLRSRKPKA